MSTLLFQFIITISSLNTFSHNVTFGDINLNDSRSPSESEHLYQNYFNYDQIDYYRLISDQRKDSLLEEASENDQSIISGFMDSEYPKYQKDTIHIDKLEKYGFKKTRVPYRKFSSINKLFRVKEGDLINPDDWGCFPIYRDILVFKKNNQIVGIAKICFGCSGSYFIGTKVTTKGFGTPEDYDKLEKILHGK
ncbi:hypothetical protein OO013_15795 [Mangrovivirga sp. M17]|uniref:Uncharacterized protein n=1 Tax=Mangrovivirga halotolerans TaxID=2993936 RepID=A0ABT3RUZ8_9BACT|nr:hypothetical protein [Mangrovivirga halotolerans]MCX2745341.1 hypothetical protein [Mangrovivirga halotolerans]